MSTVAEIEAALPGLSPEELRRVEAMLRCLQQNQSPAASAAGNSQLHSLEMLQTRLSLDPQKTDAWIAAVQDSRR